MSHKERFGSPAESVEIAAVIIVVVPKLKIRFNLRFLRCSTFASSVLLYYWRRQKRPFVTDPELSTLYCYESDVTCHLRSMTDFPVATYLRLRSSSLAFADDGAHLAGETK